MAYATESYGNINILNGARSIVVIPSLADRHSVRTHQLVGMVQPIP